MDVTTDKICIAHWKVHTLQGVSSEENTSIENMSFTDLIDLAKYMDDKEIELLGISSTGILSRGAEGDQKKDFWKIPDIHPGKDLYLSNSSQSDGKNEIIGVGILVNSNLEVEQVASPDPAHMMGLIISLHHRLKVLVIEFLFPGLEFGGVDEHVKRQETLGNFYKNLQAMIDERPDVTEVILMGNVEARRDKLRLFANVEDPKIELETEITVTDIEMRLIRFCLKNRLLPCDGTNGTFSQEYIFMKEGSQNVIALSDIESQIDLVENDNGKKKGNIGNLESDFHLIKGKMEILPFHVAHWNIRNLCLTGKHIPSSVKNYNPSPERINSVLEYMEKNNIVVLGIAETHIQPRLSEDFESRVLSYTLDKTNSSFLVFLSNAQTVAPRKKPNDLHALPLRSEDSRPGLPQSKSQGQLDTRMHNLENNHPGVALILRLSPMVRDYVKLKCRDPSRIIGIIVTIQSMVKVLVIEAYAPTEDDKDNDDDQLKRCKKQIKDKFFHYLDDMMYRHNKRENVDQVIIKGDFNARISYEDSRKSQVFSDGFEISADSRERTSENGRRLLEFCAKHELIIVNKFKLDYIITTREFEPRISDFYTHPEFEIGAATSDHPLIGAKIRHKSAPDVKMRFSDA